MLSMPFGQEKALSVPWHSSCTIISVIETKINTNNKYTR